MSDYIVPTRIVVEADSEQEAILAVTKICMNAKIYNKSLRYNVINARKCSTFLPAEDFLLFGYNLPYLNKEIKP